MDASVNQSRSADVLGGCPGCRATIPDSARLITYESALGWPSILAECPWCRDVVHPR